MHRDAARFDEAVEAFSQAGFSDDVFGPLVDANLGDCYVELGDLDAAQSHFASAASAAGAGLAANALAPMCAYKQALVLIELGNTSSKTRVGRFGLRLPELDVRVQRDGFGRLLTHGDRRSQPQRTRVFDLLNGAHFRVGIVVSEWNRTYTEHDAGAKDLLVSAGVQPEHIRVSWVPGSYELALGAVNTD